MSVCVTGDTHGDFRRFRGGVFRNASQWSREDYVLICGDFGGVWNESDEQRQQLDWLEARPFTTLFITGNHDNYDLLSTYPTAQWHGGQVQFIRPHVIHLMRGQVFEIGGKTFFTMGGASCHDVQDGILDPEDPMFLLKYRRLSRREAFFRVNHLSWWKEELPCEAEYETARANLDRCGWSVDYIITHCAPTSIQKAITGGRGGYEVNALTEFLEEVSKKCKFHLWFFGHYHDNGVIRKKYILLYKEIAAIKETLHQSDVS